MIIPEIQFKALVENSFDIFSVVDLDGNYLYNSNSISRMIGYTPSEMLGKNALNFIHPEDVEIVRSNLSKLYSVPFLNTMLPYRFRHNNGEWIWLESSGTNMLSDPSINGLVVYSRNVSDKINLEHKLSVYQRTITSAAIEAQERERTMLSLELHDNVNQVLSTVKLYLEMYILKGGSEMEMIHSSINHIQNCIHEIRSISIRLSAPTLGEIGLKDSVRELVDSINLTNRVKIDLKIMGIDEKHISKEMHTSLYRLIQEQLNNVLQHSHAKRAWVTITKIKNQLVLTIKDNGNGFDISEKSKGIGLMSIQSRIESMSGKLTIESSVGNGCTLKAVIPV
jgi:PAS domain S-box-containing protein